MAILSYLIILLFAACAVQVTLIAYKRKLTNMYWLAGNFAAAVFGNLFTSVIVVPLPGMIALIISGLCTVMFVQRTFYRDRKSPYLFILGLLVVLGAVQIYSAITNPAAYVGMTQLGFTVIWGWQAVLSFQAYRAIAHDRTVEDWVKSRYQLWFAYTFVMFFVSGRMLIPLPYAGFEYVLDPVLLLLCVVAQYVTWAMPEPIRLFLNRNYKPVTTVNPSDLMNMTEEELLKQVQS